MCNIHEEILPNFTEGLLHKKHFKIAFKQTTDDIRINMLMLHNCKQI